MAAFLKVAGIKDVPAGQGKLVGVGGKHIALFNSEGNYYAIDDTALTRVARYRTARSRVAK